MKDLVKTFNSYLNESNNAGFSINIEQETLRNTNYRKVLNTTQHNQLVVMSIKPNQDIGSEVHKDNSQFIRIEGGIGKAIIDGTEYKLSDGVSVIIPAGSEHNIINEGSSDLKLYTVYSPPVHEDALIQKEKSEDFSQNK